MTRKDYWRQVADELSADGICKQSGKPLDWETLECLAERNGMRMKNIPNPVHMAKNGLAARFEPANF